MAQFVQATLLGPWISMTGSKKMTNFTTKETKQDLAFIKELLETGRVVPVIDRSYPLCEVADSLRYLEEGHAQGKVVITFDHRQRLHPPAPQHEIRLPPLAVEAKTNIIR